MEQSLIYGIYSAETSEVMDYLDANTFFYHFGYDRDPVIGYSDYAALREIAGYPEVELKEGEYLIHCMAYLAETLEDYDKTLVMGDATLAVGGIYTGHLLQHYGTGNGHGYILIVSDEAVGTRPVHHYAFAAKTAQPVGEAQYGDLDEICDELWEKEQTGGMM